MWKTTKCSEDGLFHEKDLSRRKVAFSHWSNSWLFPLWWWEKAGRSKSIKMSLWTCGRCLGEFAWLWLDETLQRRISVQYVIKPRRSDEVQLWTAADTPASPPYDREICFIVSKWNRILKVFAVYSMKDNYNYTITKTQQNKLVNLIN